MKYKSCKGFTLVELLVVIAILAVLATVSIVGYTAFIQKANAANDKAVVAQINNILMADEAANQQPATIGKALKIINDNGLEISEILPTAKDHEIVYDVSANRFSLLKNGSVEFGGEKISSDRNLWKFVDNAVGQDHIVPETTENSLFLLNPAKTVTLTSLVGIAGTIETLNIRNETSDASIVVVGDIGRLEIDAPNATVDHYGVVNKLHITRIGTDCYKEHGFLVELERFGTGKFVACEGAQFAQSQEELAQVLGAENNPNVLAYENAATQNSANIFNQKYNYTGENPHTCSYEQIEGSATCTEGGALECVICGSEKTSETQEPLGHTEVVDQAIAATCTVSGKTEGKHCSVCDAIIVAQEDIPAKGHTEEVVSGKAATCTETGLTAGTKCSVCGEILAEQKEIPAKGHDYQVEITKEPNCTEKGAKTYTCGRCGGSYDEVIPALGHTDANADGKCDRCAPVETWTLVKSLSDLHNGDTVIIVAQDNAQDDKKYFAMSTFNIGYDYILPTNITTADGQVIYPSESVMQFRLEFVAELFWRFSNTNNYDGYLCISSDGIGFSDIGDIENPNINWAISIDENTGTAQICSYVPSSAIGYQYNPYEDKNVFSCGTDGSHSNNIMLYKLVQQDGGN